MSISCTRCGASYRIPESLFASRFAGKETTIKCKKCGSAILVRGEGVLEPSSGPISVGSLAIESVPPSEPSSNAVQRAVSSSAPAASRPSQRAAPWIGLKSISIPAPPLAPQLEAASTSEPPESGAAAPESVPPESTPEPEAPQPDPVTKAAEPNPASPAPHASSNGESRRPVPPPLTAQRSEPEPSKEPVRKGSTRKEPIRKEPTVPAQASPQDGSTAVRYLILGILGVSVGLALAWFGLEGAERTDSPLPAVAPQPIAEAPPQVEGPLPSEPEPEPEPEPAPATAEAVQPVYDEQALERVLEVGLRQAKECHREGRPVGTAEVTLTFAPSGAVSSARIDGEPIASAAVGSCILATFRALQIPAFEGPEFSVRREVTLE